MTNDQKYKELLGREKILLTDYFEELERTDIYLDRNLECPVCSHLLQRVGRCDTCNHCGWSSCSI